MAIGPLRPPSATASRTKRADRPVERRVYVKAPPRVVWAALHDPANVRTLFPELVLGPAEPAWPAAAATRRGHARLGLLRDDAMVESLEARPMTSFRLRVTAEAFSSEWRWRLEPRAGGTRVVHDAVLQPGDRIAGWLIRLGRDSVSERVEEHLRALKNVAEAAWAAEQAADEASRSA
jgi:hypothetical protein